jgi:putative membrane protein (TIGR04086 family)
VIATLAKLRWRNVLLGAVVQAAIAIPSLIIGSAVNGGNGSNAAVIALVLVLFVAPFVGGIIAAIDERSTPYVHGAVAAAIGWLAVVVHALARLIFGNGSPNAATLVVTGIVNVSIGMLGGYFSFRRALRKEGSDQSPRR